MRTVAIALLLLQAAFVRAAEPVRIRSIRIESNDVFSAEEASRGWFYTLANSIHIETRPTFLRKNLLFHENDVLDIARLAESERNLRALPFIKSASVTASAPVDGWCDVRVVTQDAWTTQPGGSLGSKGGRTNYSVEFQETDLLGTGRSVSMSYAKETDRITRMISLQDPYLFEPFWKGRLLYADSSDGRQRQVEISRPYYSFEARWSADFDLERLQQTEIIYADGEEESRFRQDHRERMMYFGRAIEANEADAKRWVAGIDSVDDVFVPSIDHPSPIVPDRREFRYLFASYEAVGNAFETVNYVNRDSRDEDFNLAPRLYVKAGLSPRALAAPTNSVFVETEASGGYVYDDNSFAQADLDVQSRLDGGFQNAIVSGFIGYVRRFPELTYPQTLVGRLQLDRGWRLDGDVQFVADGLTGLRAYRLHALTGDRRLILNLEDRFFSEKEYLQLVSPGAVIFVDAGTAVAKGRKFDLSDIRTDAGVGLRFAIARAGGNNILRIDLGYAFDRDPQGKRGLLVSFSSSQAFSFRRETPSGQ